MIGLFLVAVTALYVLARGESVISPSNFSPNVQRKDALHQGENQPAVQKRQAQTPPSPTWGPFLSLGPTKSEFVRLQMIYAPGTPPANMKGDLFLWGGLFDQENRENGDLVQTIIEAHPVDAMQRMCSAYAGQWCIRPFVVHGCCLSQAPPYGKAIGAKDKILVEYTKNPGPGGMWTQTVWNLSWYRQKLFEYAKGNAPTKWFQIATESQGVDSGTADVQNYYNITLRLREPDLELGVTFKTTGSIQSDRPFTDDGGQTWNIKHVMIPAMEDRTKTSA